MTTKKINNQAIPFWKKWLVFFLCFLVAFQPAIAASTYSYYHVIPGLKVTSGEGNGGDAGNHGGASNASYTFSAVVPSAVSTNGGVFSVTGINLTPDLVVKIDGKTVPTSFVDSGHFNVVAPAHSEGTVNVELSGRGAAFTKVLSHLPDLGFNGGFNPSWSYEGADTTVTVSGTGFFEGTSANLIDGSGKLIPIPSFYIVNNTTATFKAPLAKGNYRLFVSDKYGRSVTSNFVLDVVPLAANITATNATPREFPKEGGEITISGSGFDQNTRVMLNGMESSITYVNKTIIKAIVPPYTSTGALSLAVDNGNPAHGKISLPLGTVSYLSDASISGFSPQAGKLNTASIVTFAGNKLPSSINVQLMQSDGSVISGSVSKLSSTGFSVSFTPTVAGNAGFTVTDNAGKLIPVSTSFSVKDTAVPISFLKLDPAFASTAGNSQIIVKGSGFIPGTTITIDGSVTDGIIIESEESLRFTAPKHAAGEVVGQINNGTATVPFSLTYLDPLSIGNIYTHNSPSAENKSITINAGETTQIAITGSSLVQGIDLSVWLVDSKGGVYNAGPLTIGRFDLNSNDGSYTSLNNAGIFSITPEQDGAYAVVLRDSYGRSYTGTNLIYVNKAISATINSVTPQFAETNGGNTITIIGKGFGSNPRISLGNNIQIIQPISVSDTKIVFNAIPNQEGQTTLYVDNGSGSAAASNVFTYIQPVSVSSVAPSAVPNDAPGDITLTGSGFQYLSSALITIVPTEGQPVILPRLGTMTSDNSLTFTIPATIGSGLSAIVINDSWGRTFTYQGLILQKPASISGFSLPQKTFGDAPFDISGITSDSAGTIIYTSDDESIASISGSTVTIHGAGVATITATQEANGFFSKTSVKAKLNVSGKSPAVQAWSLPDVYLANGSFSITPPVSESSGVWRYTSEDTSIATIDPQSGVITPHAPGTAKIKATQDASGSYASVMVSTTFEVMGKVPTLGEWSIPAIKQTSGEYVFSAPASDSSGQWSYSIKSSPDCIAPVLSAGNKLDVSNAAGNCVLSATQAASADSKYTAVTTETNLHIVPPLTFSRIATPNSKGLVSQASIVVGAATNIALNISPFLSEIDGLHVWLVDNAGNISDLGLVTFGNFQSNGTGFVKIAQIAVNSNAPGLASLVLKDNYGQSFTASGVINFTPQPVDVQVQSVSANVASTQGGETITVKGTGFLSGMTLKLDTANISLNRISDTEFSFTTPAHGAGNASFVIDNLSGGLTSSFTINYLQPVVISSLSDNTVIGKTGGIVQFTGSGFTGLSGATIYLKPASGSDINVSNSLHLMSDVNFTINVPASTASGTYSIAIQDRYGRSYQPSFSIYVQEVPTYSAFVIPDKTVGDASFKIANLTSTSPAPITFTSSDPSIASVNGDQISILQAGSVTITAFQSATGNYASGSTTATLKINGKIPVVSPWSIPSVAFNTGSFKITPPVSESNAGWSYTSSDPTIASISGDTILIKKVGTVTISATQSAYGTYASASTSASLSITGSMPVIQPWYLQDTLLSNGSLQLTAPNTDSTGTWTYSSSNRAVATVDPNTGLVSLISGGTTTITASIAGTSDGAFMPSSIAATLRVVPGLNFSLIQTNADNKFSALTTVPIGEPFNYAINLDPTLNASDGIQVWIVDGDGTVREAGALRFERFDFYGGSFYNSMAQFSAGMPVSGLSAIVLKDNHGQTFTSGGVINVKPLATNVSITGLSQTYSALAGGDTITVNGSGFLPGTVVTIGNIQDPVTPTIISPNQLTFIVPSNVAGMTTVNVDNKTGGSTATTSFTYLNALSVTSSNPSSIATSTGGALNIAGSGFAGITGATVTIIPAYGNPIDVSQNIQYFNDGSIRITLPVSPQSNYGLASVSISDTYGRTYVSSGVFTMQKDPNLANFTLQNKSLGDAPFAVTGITSDSPGSISYSSSNPSVASISGNTITINGVGTTVITASQQASGVYASGSITATLTVSGNTPTIQSWTIAPVTYGASSFTLTAPTSNSSGTWSYSSSNPAVASVTSAGVVTIVSAGNAVITANQAAKGNYLAGSVNATLTVNKATPTLGAFTVPSYESDVGQVTLNPPSSNSTGAWSYAISDATIGTISGNKLTVLKDGTATITVSQVADANYAATSTTATLQVNKLNAFSLKDSSGVAFSGNSTSIAGVSGGTYTQQVRIYNGKSYAVSLTSLSLSNTSNVSVDQSCVKSIPAASYCTATITYSPSAPESKSVTLSASGSNTQIVSLTINLSASSPAKAFVAAYTQSVAQLATVNLTLPAGSSAGDMILIAYTQQFGIPSLPGGSTLNAGTWPSYGYTSGTMWKILSATDITANKVVVTSNAGASSEQVYSVMTYRGYSGVTAYNTLTDSLTNYSSSSINGINGGLELTFFADRSHTVIPVNASSGSVAVPNVAKLVTFFGVNAFSTQLLADGQTGIKRATGGTVYNGVGYSVTIN